MHYGLDAEYSYTFTKHLSVINQEGSDVNGVTHLDDNTLLSLNKDRASWYLMAGFAFLNNHKRLNGDLFANNFNMAAEKKCETLRLSFRFKLKRLWIHILWVSFWRHHGNGDFAFKSSKEFRSFHSLQEMQPFQVQWQSQTEYAREAGVEPSEARSMHNKDKNYEEGKNRTI